MIEKTYRVLIDGVTVATGMSIEHATIFLKALFLEYYNDTDMAVAIRQDDIDDYEGDHYDEQV